MMFGTIAAYNGVRTTTSHWACSSDIEFGHTVYIGLSAVIMNLMIAVILTVILRAARVPQGADETLPHQYTADPVGRGANPGRRRRRNVAGKREATARSIKGLRGPAAPKRCGLLPNGSAQRVRQGLEPAATSNAVFA